jgi:hypothetical protein
MKVSVHVHVFHFIVGERALDMFLDVLLGGPQNQCGCVRGEEE